MNQITVENEYFDWLCGLVCGERFSNSLKYHKLLIFLHRTKFKWTIRRDSNRASDGIDLRYRFSQESGYDPEYLAEYIDGPCSVLEMMVALSIRCEEDIMDDTEFGDRTGQWFWKMLNNIGIDYMDDTQFDKGVASEKIDIFLNREYSKDGKGGLFRIRGGRDDLRNVEIWTQMLWYLNKIRGE